MTVTPLQYQRHAAAEASQLRMTRLLRMSYPELHRLLAGDPRETAAWVRSAAEHGVIEAQLLLGRMALEGQGMAPNPAEALHWFTVAAARGDAEAMNMLGRAHELGWGTEIDLPAAAAWYKRSADGAHDWGEYNYANMLFDGLGLTIGSRPGRGLVPAGRQPGAWPGDEPSRPLSGGGLGHAQGRRRRRDLVSPIGRDRLFSRPIQPRRHPDRTAAIWGGGPLAAAGRGRRQCGNAPNRPAAARGESRLSIPARPMDRSGRCRPGGAGFLAGKRPLKFRKGPRGRRIIRR